MSSQASTAGTAQVHSLRADTLGVGAVIFLVVSAAAPMTAVAGAVPIAMLLGNGAGIPAAFVLVTAILLLFSVGYVAMARHVKNAGAFYAYAAQGLGGGAAGVAAAIAILAYNAMQIGLYGMFGAAASGFLAGFGWNVEWWVPALIALGVIAVLGYRRVDLSAKILAILVALEYLVVIIVDIGVLSHKAVAASSVPLVSTRIFFSGSPVIGLLFCFAAFVGFEATTIYSEEARNAHTTIPRATYISVITIGVFYAFSSWVMVVSAGTTGILPALNALKDPTDFLFNVAQSNVGGWIVPLMHLLFASSVFAGLLAFHNNIARYVFVAGREGLLPNCCGRTHGRFQSPHVGSVAQSVIAICVLALFIGAGLDPVLSLFSWLTNLATLGIIALMGLTAFAIPRYFSRNPSAGEGPLKVIVAPLLSGLVLVALFVLVVMHFGDLAGAHGVLGAVLPSLIGVAAVVGYVLALRLKARDARLFSQLGANRV